MTIKSSAVCLLNRWRGVIERERDREKACESLESGIKEKETYSGVIENNFHQ